MSDLYATGTNVRFNMLRCACVGGGTMQAEGTIVGLMTTPGTTQWYQINQPNGIVVVKHENILSVI